MLHNKEVISYSSRTYQSNTTGISTIRRRRKKKSALDEFSTDTVKNFSGRRDDWWGWVRVSVHYSNFALILHFVLDWFRYSFVYFVPQLVRMPVSFKGISIYILNKYLHF